MEMKSSPPCPPTVTVRRNPPRKARTTPASAIPLGQPLSTPSAIPPFPIEDILSDTVNNTRSNAPPAALAENLKVYLRIRPLTVQNNANAKRIAESKNAWPKNPKTKITSRSKVAKNNEVCVQVNEDLCSVTVSTPQSQQETKRLKSEVYEGFSRVFPSEASQSDVYEEMVKPLVEDFVKGKCGMLAAMGPSGSGKTHTVFGSGREPGMVPLALRGLFSKNRSSETELSRTYYFSMMEISSERGKGERIIDLLHDGGPIYMQQSVVKGIQEAVVCDAQQAESLIARGMLKRATATTNSNTQSSRSQCIINIRCASKNRDGGFDGKGGTTLTIVDLAGAEKEKKTGNQGARLLESNFINNTSMVFGLCLRSLLEHQKNRNKQLPKHYHNSLLTRYMREYLEGKKRMALILTVKPGIEDYPDTTFLLRQASPFANIKFKNVEEPVNLNCSKRPSETLPRLKQLKKMKFGDNEASVIDEGNISRGLPTEDCKKIAKDVVMDRLVKKIEDIEDENLIEIPVLSDESAVFGTSIKLAEKRDHGRNKADKDREYQFLLGLSKAFWTALKQHKEELEVLKIEKEHLRNSLSNEKSRSLGLENELNSEKMRRLDLENELKELRIRFKSREASTDILPVSIHDVTSNLSQYQMTEQQEVSSEVLPYCLKELEQTSANEEKTDNSVIDASAVISCSTSGDKEHFHQVKDTSTVDSFSRDQDSSSCNNIDAVDCDVTTQSTSACVSSSSDCEQVVKITGNEKSLEFESESVPNELSCPTYLECESVSDSPHDEDLRDAGGKLTQLQNSETGEQHQIASVAAHSDNDRNFSVSPQKDDKCLYVDEELITGHNEKEQLNPQVKNLPSKGQHAKIVSNSVPKHSPHSKFKPAEKPKRRLLPASSVLLKDISILDVKDENDKPKVGKGRKVVAMDDKNRTQGSLSLLHLLKTNLSQ